MLVLHWYGDYCKSWCGTIERMVTQLKEQWHCTGVDGPIQAKTYESLMKSFCRYSRGQQEAFIGRSNIQPSWVTGMVIFLAWSRDVSCEESSIICITITSLAYVALYLVVLHKLHYVTCTCRILFIFYITENCLLRHWYSLSLILSVTMLTCISGVCGKGKGEGLAIVSKHGTCPCYMFLYVCMYWGHMIKIVYPLDLEVHSS